MALIIDGYNLLNASGIVGGGAAGGTLETSRRALLDFLACRLQPAERRTTAIVFDARQAPPGLQRTLEYRGMSVRFAPRQSEADDVIEQLIRADSAPRRLTVVSSDHRLQRAARRRRAIAVDSEIWLRRFRNRPPITSGQPESSPLPDAPCLDPDLEQWLRCFSEPASTPLRSRAAGADAAPGDDNKRSNRRSPPESADRVEPGEWTNPFPPGYGQDLLDGGHDD